MEDISVSIYGPDSIEYQGKVSALTSVNDKGTFDILPLHSNFITVIKNKLILYESTGNKKEISLTQGVLKAVKNQVSIFLGIEGLREK